MKWKLILTHLICFTFTIEASVISGSNPNLKSEKEIKTKRDFKFFSKSTLWLSSQECRRIRI